MAMLTPEQQAIISCAGRSGRSPRSRRCCASRWAWPGCWSRTWRPRAWSVFTSHVWKQGQPDLNLLERVLSGLRRL